MPALVITLSTPPQLREAAHMMKLLLAGALKGTGSSEQDHSVWHSARFRVLYSHEFCTPGEFGWNSARTRAAHACERMLQALMHHKWLEADVFFGVALGSNGLEYISP